MARIRSIKPDFWTSDQVMACSRDARLLFIGIWNFCDDAGRCLDNERTIKAKILPNDDDIDSSNVRRMLDELSSNGLLRPYEVNGQKYLQVTGWHHQKIDRPRPSKFPRPLDEDSSNDRRSLDDGSDRSGSEGIKDLIGAGETRAPSSIRLPEDWKPTENAVSRAKGLGLTDDDLAKMLLRFGPHYRARGEQRADWDEQFLAWCADEVRKLGRAPATTPAPVALEVPVDPSWAPIKQHLEADIGQDAFRNWFSNVAVEIDGETLTLSGPSKFVVSQWNSQFFDKVFAAASVAYPKVTRVQLKVQTERKTA